MTAIQRLRNALQVWRVDDKTLADIFAGYEKVTDQTKKEVRAEFFIQAVQRMEDLLGYPACQEIRDACACSLGGWRLKAMQKIARDLSGKNFDEKLAALREVTYMGNPILNPDGSITAGIGDKGGFECPCPVFQGVELKQPVPILYCYCCAGHFRHHYQIALGVNLKTRLVYSSALASDGIEPCRFVYDIAG